MGESEEYYPIIFKAIVDKNGRITIPLAERKIAAIKPYTIVQVKMRILESRKEEEAKKVDYNYA